MGEFFVDFTFPTNTFMGTHLGMHEHTRTRTHTNAHAHTIKTLSIACRA